MKNTFGSAHETSNINIQFGQFSHGHDGFASQGSLVNKRNSKIQLISDGFMVCMIQSYKHFPYGYYHRYPIPHLVRGIGALIHLFIQTREFD
jgi:hypothetical protein